MKKKVYIVSIEETCVQDFKIEAESLEKAEEIAEQLYHEGKIILAPGQLTEKNISAFDASTGKHTDWRRF